MSWVIDGQPPAFVARLRDHARAVLAERLASSEEQAAAAAAAEPERLLAHGVLGEARRRSVARAALVEICIPCAEALFGAAERRRAA